MTEWKICWNELETDIDVRVAMLVCYSIRAVVLYHVYVIPEKRSVILAWRMKDVNQRVTADDEHTHAHWWREDTFYLQEENRGCTHRWGLDRSLFSWCIIKSHKTAA